MRRITGYRKTSAAAFSWRAARLFLEMAQKSREGQFFTCAASLVFSAFTHEAFLNSLGPKVIDDWDERERMSVHRKLEAILKATNHQPDLGGRPYQTLSGLLKFRNRLAHGREEVVREEGKSVKGESALDFFDALGPDWEQYCTVENAEAAVEDINAIATDLNQAANIERFAGYPFGSIGVGTYKIE